MKLIDKLQTGDVVFTSCSNAQLCYHIGIVYEDDKGRKKVFHNAPTITNRYGGNVCSETWEDFLKGSYVYKVVRTKVSNDRILKVSRMHKRERWHELFFNCEDYIIEIITGKRRSNQRDAFKIILLGLTVIFLL